MKRRCYAKINLCLNVVSARTDGYHELQSIMVPINFYDVLTMVPAEETSLVVNRSFLPVDEKNTVIQAIRLVQRKFGVEQEFACSLQKQIPSRAGLAGGSADGAAALHMLNKFCRLYLTDDELYALGKEIGADVPFCLLNTPAYVSGIGEKLMPFTCSSSFYILLVKPKSGISTKESFAFLDAQKDVVHPDCQKMKNALESDDYDGIVSSLGNSLEAASLAMLPEIREIKQDLLDLGLDGSLMSGSGSTVFGLSRNRRIVDHAMEEMKKKGYFVRRTLIYKGEKR